jgi:crotonobetaine/carnitine-CoA ligase
MWRCHLFGGMGMLMLDTDTLKGVVYAQRSVGDLLANQAESLGGKPFVSWRGAATSYSDMDHQANRVANSLLAVGVRPGARVALMMTNSPDWIAVWFGVMRVGAVLVPINTAYKHVGLAYQLSDSRASVLIIDSDLATRVDALDPPITIEHVFVTPGYVGPASVKPIAQLFESSASAPAPISIDPETPATILYTSGTTGPPKGCLLPHGQYLAAAYVHADACGYSRESVVYTCLPLFHINAQNYTVLSVLAAGGTIALDDKFSASRFWETLIEVGATAFNFIGSMTASLWNREPRPAEKQHRATVAYGVPLSTDTWADWEERFNVRVVYAYGMTENALPNIVDLVDTPVPAHLRGSAGRASPTSEVSIVDERDLPVAAGQVGEILTRPKIPWTMMIEYVDKPDATIEAFRGCWFHTGDLGYLDDEGYLFYVDRKKDAVRRRGEMVSSWEVEASVRRYAGVQDCAMIGVPSPMGEDEILIVLVYDGNFDPDSFIEFCTDQMAKFQVPRYVRLLPELPRTQTQRVEKYRLRQEGITPDTWDAEA